MISREKTQPVTMRAKSANALFLKIFWGIVNRLKLNGRFSPSLNLLITVGGISLAETITTLFISVVKGWPYYMVILIDVAIMILILIPLLYYFSFKPMSMQAQQLSDSDNLLRVRMRLIDLSRNHSVSELLQFILDETETLTGSQIGFFHFLEADQSTLWLRAWSTNTLRYMCKADGKDTHYSISQAGVWADAARLRRPVIHNEFAALPNRKEMPEGHALVIREMVLPILREGKVVAILGLGNKPQDYTVKDVELVATLADFTWDVVDHIQGEDDLEKSEEKFRNLVDWTYDWEMWLDPKGSVIYTSPSCERITGYPPEDFMQDGNLLNSLIHPEDRPLMAEHSENNSDPSIGTLVLEYRIISKDGSEHWIEHICRPLFGPERQFLGRRISNRDITDRKKAEQKILEQTQKEGALIQTIQNIQTDMARDLHDTLGQNISFLRMNLMNLLESKSVSQSEKQIQSMAKAADESYELIRALLSVLQFEYSSDPLSLFSRYAKQVTDRSGIDIGIDVHGDINPLSPYQNRHLFYIFREALSNIEKHAKASQVEVVFMWGKDAVTLDICDDGVGFIPQAVDSSCHYGLSFMAERTGLLKGSYHLDSAPGQGTRISVVVPYD